ncbi:MAG TPA: efflux RND transporter permease subunit [Phenylobacterium sp.]|jgi:CzcA family heavy metal efflux pump|uniref:efflux RND transporter permease subunit n=1 Tax=Phenylobacterium sp. TaxID=1871053 RepID=UPI002D55E773|nr:efflux RND transporter permease subunit [Phenylobacterium sp.]HZZ69505.1 efflux RND transporter permease subunit [Phenylobacterium sp.]
MTLSALVSRRRRSLLTLLSMMIAAGVVAAFVMPVGLFPNVLFPRIAVTIDAGDRPPDQMEAVVTRPVEQAVRAIPGVLNLRSTTSRGSAELSLNFAWGSNMDLALQRVQAALTQAQSGLPQGVAFDVRRMDPTTFPVAAYSLTSATATPVELRRFADRKLSPLLSTINGVARVADQGGAAGEYRVETDPAKLWANGLSVADVTTAISGANVLAASGRIEDQGKLLLVLTDSRLTDPRAIENVVVKTVNGAVVRVRDVATVRAAPEPQWIRVTADGRDAVLVNVFQQPGGNTVQIAKDVRAVIAKATAQGPADMQVKAWYDQSDLILDSAGSLRNAIIIGVILAALVLLAFLRDWKVTLAAVIAVPAVLAVTTLILKLAGQSFNIMTLGGMAAAIGLIIDDAIVMIEHIERRIAETADSGRPTVDRAVAEFLRPLMSSSAATIVIFLPLAFLTGVTGAFFKALSITMAVALTVSFLVAWWLVPVLVEQLVKSRSHVAQLDPDGRIMRRYRSALEGAVRRPWIAVASVAALAGVGVLAFLNVGTGFIPKIDEGGFILDYVAPPGMSLTETDRLMRRIEGIIRATPDVDTYSRRTGIQLGGGLTEPNTGDFFIRLKTHGRRKIDEVMNDVRTKVQSSVPGVDIETAQLMEDLIGDLTAVPQPIEVKLYSDDVDLLQKTGPEVMDKISKVAGITELKSGVVIAGDGLQIKVDPVKSELEGIDAGEASKQLESLLTGDVATQIQSGANLANVRVWIPDQDRGRIGQLPSLLLKSPNDGHLFPVSRIAEINVINGQAEINREDMRRMDAVTARVEGRDTGSAAAEVQAMVAKPGVLPPGVSFEMGGLFAEQQAAFRGMALVFAAAVAAVFVLLMLVYESFRTAFTILLMPLAAASAVAIGLWLVNVELNIMALMGATMILGIATEVAIFYFTEYEALVDEGMEPQAALVQAGVNRLRPIAMTTLAAILALAPLALALGGGSSMERPLAIAIIAGLIAQGPLVLLAMPAIYRLLGGAKPRDPEPVPAA